MVCGAVRLWMWGGQSWEVELPVVSLLTAVSSRRCPLLGTCICFFPPRPRPRPPRTRTAGTWFERRLAYARSTAVASMAGHIIGLGDRHLQNILLDTRSADAVHIDLGIAFEQVGGQGVAVGEGSGGRG